MKLDRTIQAVQLFGVLAIALASCQTLPAGDRSAASTKSEPVASPSPSPAVQEPQAQTYQVVPGSIYDGDTLRVTDGATQTKIRLCGIDAPEKDQPMGVASRDHLRSLINKGDGSIQVIEVEQDRYGRTVAELFLKAKSGETIAINSQMVADGFAYHYARYSGGCPHGSTLAPAEASAEKQGLGVWKNPNAQKPWDYRKTKR